MERAEHLRSGLGPAAHLSWSTWSSCSPFLGPAAHLSRHREYLLLQRRTSLSTCVWGLSSSGSFVAFKERGRCSVMLRAVVGPGGGRSGGATYMYLTEMIAQHFFIILGFAGNAKTLWVSLSELRVVWTKKFVGSHERAFSFFRVCVKEKWNSCYSLCFSALLSVSCCLTYYKLFSHE